VGRRSMPDLQAIGCRIRSLRTNARQVEFASQLRISQGQLSKIERGDVAPTLDVLVMLSAKFGKTIDWIVKGDD
jgi:transcriptional regulator with XRE-family HTH domain